MKRYKADIAVRCVGVITNPNIQPDNPRVRYSSCLTREVYPAASVIEARERAIALVQNPNTSELQKCLEFYSVPHKTLAWESWQPPREPEGETQIYSCKSESYLIGVFKWIVRILLYEVEAR